MWWVFIRVNWLRLFISCHMSLVRAQVRSGSVLNRYARVFGLHILRMSACGGNIRDYFFPKFRALFLERFHANCNSNWSIQCLVNFIAYALCWHGKQTSSPDLGVGASYVEWLLYDEKLQWLSLAPHREHHKVSFQGILEHKSHPCDLAQEIVVQKFFNLPPPPPSSPLSDPLP